MRRSHLLPLAVLMTVALAAGCSAAKPPTWTFPPANAVPAVAASAATSSAAPAAPSSAPGGSTAVAGTVELTAFDLGFTPKAVTVAAAGRYAFTLKNTGAMTHDLTFADGSTTGPVDAGKSATVEVNVPAAGIAFLCSVPGHAAAGMTGTVAVTGATAGGDSHGGPAPDTGTVKPDPAAPKYTLYDATAPKVLDGTTHDIDLVVKEMPMTVGETPEGGFVQAVWTFNGTVPGPVIRVHLGDTVRIHLKNPATNQLSHSVDFHASQVAWNDEMTSIKPGEEKLYEWTADYAGVWMYHCGTAPALHHIANGMYGMVIVEPKGGFKPVDHEFALVQSEWYLGPQGQPVGPDQGGRRGARARTSSSSTASRTSTRTIRSRSAPARPCGSSCSTPVRTSTARSTSSARSSTPSSRKASPLTPDNPGHYRLAGGGPVAGAGRDRRVHDSRGWPLPDRHPRLQLRRPRRARPGQGRGRRPEELGPGVMRSLPVMESVAPEEPCCEACAARGGSAASPAPTVALAVRATAPVRRADDRRTTFGGLLVAASFLALGLLAAILGSIGGSGTVWPALHLVLAGAAGTAVASVMPFFTASLARVAPAGLSLRVGAIALVSSGALAVTVGWSAGLTSLAVAGGCAYLGGLALTAAAAFLPLRATLGHPPRLVTAAYAAALVEVAVGATLATSMVAGWTPVVGDWSALKPAHAWLNLFGFLSVVVAATLLHLAPTAAGTRIRPRATGTVALVGLAFGAPLIALGSAGGWDAVARIGAAVELVGAAALAAHAMGVVHDRGRWTTDAGWHAFTNVVIAGCSDLVRGRRRDRGGSGPLARGLAGRLVDRADRRPVRARVDRPGPHRIVDAHRPGDRAGRSARSRGAAPPARLGWQGSRHGLERRGRRPDGRGPRRRTATHRRRGGDQRDLPAPGDRPAGGLDPARRRPASTQSDVAHAVNATMTQPATIVIA